MGFVAAIAPILSAVASIAPMFMGGGGSKGGGAEAPSFQPPPPAPNKSDEDIQEQEKAERLRRSKASGISSTNRTSGLGIQEEPLVQKPTLFGE